MADKRADRIQTRKQVPRSKIAAARLIIKRAEEGKGKIPVTPRIRELAELQ
ncbi:RNA helicase [Corynebacterium tuberculostearicum]|uniref:RNA helicase n=1 Tax=Corynebacterium tuberculostearicum TaxID=38304 RepID=UPI0029348ABF|nr:RNA helicase [Corynebacterium tuberculostearicum]MDV2428803.1 RNA helicase [Corynebacterium tuberculostearicum]